MKRLSYLVYSLDNYAIKLCIESLRLTLQHILNIPLLQRMLGPL
jgi:hypothetical protein